MRTSAHAREELAGAGAPSPGRRGGGNRFMAVRSVHWHEGMFLWPQQMQQAERFFAHQVHLSGTWDTHYNWGLRAFEIDMDALGNFRFVVRGLRARLRQGAIVAVPEDTSLPVVD